MPLFEMQLSRICISRSMNSVIKTSVKFFTFSHVLVYIQVNIHMVGRKICRCVKKQTFHFSFKVYRFPVLFDTGGSKCCLDREDGGAHS